MSGIIPYRAGDFQAIHARQDFAQARASDVFLDGEPQGERSWSLVDDEDQVLGCQVLGCGGWIEEKPGVISLWGYCADGLSRRDWMIIAGFVRELVKGFFAGQAAHRVQAMARADHAEAVRFLWHMGLKDDVNCLVAFGSDGGDIMVMAALSFGGDAWTQ